MADKKRLIDANALDTRERGNNSQRTMWHTIKRLIDNSPTVDAVEVVRCKDCMHSSGTRVVPNTAVCFKSGTIVPAEHFCSYGERKDNG